MLKTISSITNALGALNYKGTWNASTNTPTLVSSVGAKGDYYVVSVAGSTNLNGETLWGVGDWAVFNGSVWQRVEGGNTINATTVSASTSVSTPVIQALSSAGGTLKNDGGTNQMQWGLGGGNNLSLEVATNINPANAAVAISPTGTGTVTINPATASTMNNVAIGGTTALAGSFTTVTATTGNFVVGTSGQGVDFAATPGTGTSELLADYEEGTWTPSVGGNATYTAQSGYYTKVGNLVKLRFLMTINVLGTGSTTTISGMPFDPSGNQPVIVGGVVCYANNLATAALSLGVYAQNGSFIRFFSRDLSLTTATNQAVAVIGNGFDVYAEVTYQV
jgi:hypothetical protein